MSLCGVTGLHRATFSPRSRSRGRRGGVFPYLRNLSQLSPEPALQHDDGQQCWRFLTLEVLKGHATLRHRL